MKHAACMLAYWSSPDSRLPRSPHPSALRRTRLRTSSFLSLPTTAGGEWSELTTATFSHDPAGKADRLDRFMDVEQVSSLLTLPERAGGGRRHVAQAAD
jgi:hypothetical protein